MISATNYLSVGSGEYACGNNLYLIVAPSGGRRWAVRYQRNGVVKKMGLGLAKAAGLKLSEAKDKAIDALRLLAKGTDPREHRNDEKRRAQGSRLFGEFAEEWRQTYEAGLKHKAAQQAQAHRAGYLQAAAQAAARRDRDRARHCRSAQGLASARNLARHASADQEDSGRSHSAEPATETQPGRLGQPTEADHA